MGNKKLTPTEQNAHNIKKLKEFVQEFKTNQGRTNGDIRNISNRLDRRLKHISPKEIEPKLVLLEARVDELNFRYNLLIEKTTVITEVLYWMRLKDVEKAGDCATACIWALDAMDNEWWNSRSHYKIREWFADIWIAWTDYQEVQNERTYRQVQFDGSYARRAELSRS